MKKIRFFLTVLAVLLSNLAFAQNLTVTGDVTDASTGEPVPFASVHEKGTMNGVNTDADGHYTITVGQNSVLVFSSIGYATVEVAVEGKMQVNCELPLDAETLETAIAVGYGSAKKVGTMIGSVTTVKSEGIKNAPSSSALDALQGQVAGLAVMTTGGVAGENNVSMTLHGVGSLGSSSAPLYIIDGVQASSSAIMNMNPNDILSISILKDASATSIYGSRAANGVVFVTTRTGSYDAKATVTIRSQAGISTLADNTLYENMMTGEELKDFWIRTGIATPQYIYDTYTSQGHDHNTPAGQLNGISGAGLMVILIAVQQQNAGSRILCRGGFWLIQLKGQIAYFGFNGAHGNGDVTVVGLNAVGDSHAAKQQQKQHQKLCRMVVFLMQNFMHRHILM